ncbi:hypothetical protein LEP1GSC199_1420 [Leptospira vanthielii serovar Holland str. Waz Holland = ATCC 700522]|uniref:Uncharacterized protein n=1 Tax=Leptospira vanthielii serovar Holland str. Waz Holland = ATCC 700522 TaxID=1218591 RepID=N1W541_9LEPT|nr:hypothetical protein LEP1GSC199_1420 [Leptospira vanthielii serovar Holland str. Waz Holland = ATCC 700522]
MVGDLDFKNWQGHTERISAKFSFSYGKKTLYKYLRFV